MRHTILLAIALLAAAGAHAQSTEMNNYNMETLARMSPASTGFWGVMQSRNTIVGHPFLYDDWQEGYLLLKGNQFISEKAGLMLDLQENQLYVLLTDEFVSQFPVGRVEQIELIDGADTLVFRTYDLKASFGEGPAGNRFFEVLYDGEPMILHGHYKYLQREKDIENLGLVRRPDKYEAIHSYWLIRDGQAVGLKKNEKELLKALPQEAARIGQLIDTHKLRLNNREDFHHLFRLLARERTE